MLARIYGTTYLGELRRLLQESEGQEVKLLIKNIEGMIKENINFIEKNSNYKTIPISKLIDFQINSVLTTLRYLQA